jgi:hypothetical protein
MTIQVGMVGMDGILLAGDTRWTKTPLLINKAFAAGRYGFSSPKIKINHERKMAISCAMDMETAGHLADEIFSGLKNEEFEQPVLPLEMIGRKVLLSAGERNNAHCLVVLPNLKLFMVQFAMFNGEWAPFSQPMDTIAIAGDNVNASIFWVERYYQKLAIEKLIPLAAHLIVCAHKLNTGTVSGLEVVLCTASSIRRLSDESIHELELKAEEWDKHIGELFLNHRQQFTYAPDMIR